MKPSWPIWGCVLLSGALIVSLMQHCGPTPTNEAKRQLQIQQDSLTLLHQQNNALVVVRSALQAQLHVDSMTTHALRVNMASAASREAQWKLVADSLSSLTANDSTNPGWHRRAVADEHQLTECHSQLSDCESIHHTDSTQIVAWRGLYVQDSVIREQALRRADSLAAIAFRMPEPDRCTMLRFFPCPSRKTAIVTGFVLGSATGLLAAKSADRHKQ